MAFGIRAVAKDRIGEHLYLIHLRPMPNKMRSYGRHILDTEYTLAPIFGAIRRAECLVERQTTSSCVAIDPFVERVGDIDRAQVEHVAIKLIAFQTFPTNRTTRFIAATMAWLAIVRAYSALTSAACVCAFGRYAVHDKLKAQRLVAMLTADAISQLLQLRRRKLNDRVRIQTHQIPFGLDPEAELVVGLLGIDQDLTDNIRLKKMLERAVDGRLADPVADLEHLGHELLDLEYAALAKDGVENLCTLCGELQTIALKKTSENSAQRLDLRIVDGHERILRHHR